MSDSEHRSKRISQRIAASQARLDRDGQERPTVPHLGQLPDSDPPENYRGLVAEYPWLTLAAGLGLGFLAGSLLPKVAGGKLGRRMVSAAAAAAELGVALSKHARERASEGAREGLALLDKGTAPMRQRAGVAGRNARSRGVGLARDALKLAARLRR